MGDQDNRGAPRNRVLKGGTIIFNNRSSTLPCTVRDISDTGARLKVAKGMAVPNRFDLLIEVDGLEAPCTVAWRRGEEIGVTFETPPVKRAPKRVQVVTAIDRSTPSLRRKP